MKLRIIIISLVLSGCAGQLQQFISAPSTKCTVSKVNSVTTISCTDGTSSTVTDGINGLNGVNGADAVQSPLDVIAILAPCAIDPMHPTTQELSDPMLEVFLRLRNGLVLSSVSQNIAGDNTHFGVLSPGTYVSTGTSNCVFTFHADGTVTR